MVVVVGGGDGVSRFQDFEHYFAIVVVVVVSMSRFVNYFYGYANLSRYFWGRYMKLAGIFGVCQNFLVFFWI